MTRINEIMKILFNQKKIKTNQIVTKLIRMKRKINFQNLMLIYPIQISEAINHYVFKNQL